MNKKREKFFNKKTKIVKMELIKVIFNFHLFKTQLVLILTIIYPAFLKVNLHFMNDNSENCLYHFLRCQKP